MACILIIWLEYLPTCRCLGEFYFLLDNRKFASSITNESCLRKFLFVVFYKLVEF